MHSATPIPAPSVLPGSGRLAHAPQDHPRVSAPKIGILLANLGTPDNYDYWSMRRYLGEFLSDRRVVDLPRWKWVPLLQLIILSFRPFSSGANYKQIWNHDRNESPLLTITRDQTEAIARVMAQHHGQSVMVDFCMRYGNPSTAAKVGAMVAAGCEKILFFPLYPHYAGATSAKYVFSAADSKVAFTGAKVTRKHEGSFGNFTGTVLMDERPRQVGISLAQRTVGSNNAVLSDLALGWKMLDGNGGAGRPPGREKSEIMYTLNQVVIAHEDARGIRREARQ